MEFVVPPLEPSAIDAGTAHQGGRPRGRWSVSEAAGRARLRPARAGQYLELLSSSAPLREGYPAP